MAALLIHIFLVEEETEYHKPSSVTEVLRTVGFYSFCLGNNNFYRSLFLSPIVTLKKS